MRRSVSVEAPNSQIHVVNADDWDVPKFERADGVVVAGRNSLAIETLMWQDGPTEVIVTNDPPVHSDAVSVLSIDDVVRCAFVRFTPDPEESGLQSHIFGRLFKVPNRKWGGTLVEREFEEEAAQESMVADYRLREGETSAERNRRVNKRALAGSGRSANRVRYFATLSRTVEPRTESIHPGQVFCNEYLRSLLPQVSKEVAMSHPIQAAHVRTLRKPPH